MRLWQAGVLVGLIGLMTRGDWPLGARLLAAGLLTLALWVFDSWDDM